MNKDLSVKTWPHLFNLFITLFLASGFVIALIFFFSRTPGKSIYYFFIGPFINKYYLGNMLNSGMTLMIVGLGISFAFKSAVFNLGGEGQVYNGALVATVICLAFPGQSGFFIIPFALVTAIIASGLLAFISGILKMKWNVDELISSFLISGAVIQIINYLITGPLDDPANNLLATRTIAGQFFFPRILIPSALNTSILYALLLPVLAFMFFSFTHWGYEMIMCGQNRQFSHYGGIKVDRYLVLPMMVSGGLHGLAGGTAVLGTYHICYKGVTAGIGWNGIAVALIARNHPLGVIPAALFFAYLEAGAKAVMLHSDVTMEIAALAHSIIFYFITAQFLYQFIKQRRRKHW
ncbi:MAG: ABC transporter permease [Spirochaetales bacterium]|nr:ABC transporter permease [Spirochaetales bacterium]